MAKMLGNLILYIVYVRNPTFAFEEKKMNLCKFFALVLIIGGVLGLVYSHFTYTPIDVSIKKEEGERTVYIPTWAGISAIALGSVFLLVSRKDD
jgi:hypothetical protein